MMSTPLPSPVLADARRAALTGLIDYAGLFPPAALGMAEAVAGYRAARRSPAPDLLGRFICPAGRLEELAAELVSTMVEGEEHWPISLLFADRAAARQGADFLTALGPAARIELAEGRLPDDPDEAAALVTALARLGPQACYLEVPAGDHIPAALDAVAAVARVRGPVVGAKLRCGGLDAAAFPEPAAVAAFIAGCRQRGLAFKATAGLHHPFRHDDPATGFTHHGFVNLLAAAALASAHDLGAAELAPIVAERDPQAFSLTRRALAWRHLEADAATVRRVRAAGFRSYGSCDFAEPVEDLTALGILPFGEL